MIQYQKKNLTLGDSSEELLSEDSGGLPFVCHYDESRLFTGHHIPWHWHDWIEINYIDKGSYQMHSPDSDLTAVQGEVVFINRNIMHACDFPTPVNYYSYTFDSRFLAGEFGSYIDRKYFAPILRSKSLSVLHIRPDTPRRIRMIELILQLTDVLRDEPDGYELTVREIISRFFLLMLTETEEIRAAEKKGNERDLERMKLMLQYIYAHYSEPGGNRRCCRDQPARVYQVLSEVDQPSADPLPHRIPGADGRNAAGAYRRQHLLNCRAMRLCL